MSKAGYTRVFRKRWEKGYHKGWLLWVMMAWFRDFACWEDKKVFSKGEIVHLKRGQVLFGQEDLAEFLGATRQQIRTGLEIMKKAEYLTIRTTRRGSIATVLNYDKYQILIAEITSSQPTDEPAANQQPTTTKELKELKERKKEKGAPPKKKKKPKGIKIDDIIDPRINIKALRDFYQHRIDSKKKMTDHAVYLLLESRMRVKGGKCYAEYTHEEQQIMVDDAIVRGWQAPFPSSLDNSAAKKQFNDPFAAEREAERQKRVAEQAEIQKKFDDPEYMKRATEVEKKRRADEKERDDKKLKERKANGEVIKCTDYMESYQKARRQALSR